MKSKMKNGNMKQKIRKIAVCEDSPVQQRNLCRMLNNWCESRGYTAKVTIFATGETLLFAWSEQMDFDLMILDIDLGKEKLNGIEIAERIRKKDETVSIIFVTALSEYMSRGYDMQALHFLVKPVEEKRLYEVLDRANKQAERKEETLLLEQETELCLIPVRKILYAEAFSHSVSLVLEEEEDAVKKEYQISMKDLETRLQEHGFFRCHRSYLVSLRHIKQISKGEIFLSKDQVIPVGRTKEKQLFQAFISYHKAVGNIC